jgi:hypothetical protein
VGADPDSLMRLLRYLVARGVFAETDGRYENTELSRLLIEEGGWRQWLDLDGAPGVRAESWARLLASVRTGSPGRDDGWSYEELARSGRAASFDAPMAAQGQANAEQIAAAYDRSSVGHVVDVGGGTGILARTLLAAHAQLRATLFDLPQVVASVEPAERPTIVPGNVFDDPVPGADACILSQIIHGWPDEGAERILRRCAEAAERILLVEGVLPERPSAGDASFDLFMLTLTGGRQRTEDEFRRLAESVGPGALVLTAARDRQRAGRAAGRLTGFVALDTRSPAPPSNTRRRPRRSASEPSAPAPGHPYLRLPLQFSVALESRLLEIVSEDGLASLRREAETELAEPGRWGHDPRAGAGPEGCEVVAPTAAASRAA